MRGLCACRHLPGVSAQEAAAREVHAAVACSRPRLHAWCSASRVQHTWCPSSACLDPPDESHRTTLRALELVVRLGSGILGRRLMKPSSFPVEGVGGSCLQLKNRICEDVGIRAGAASNCASILLAHKEAATRPIGGSLAPRCGRQHAHNTRCYCRNSWSNGTQRASRGHPAQTEP